MAPASTITLRKIVGTSALVSTVRIDGLHRPRPAEIASEKNSTIIFPLPIEMLHLLRQVSGAEPAGL